MIKVLLLIFLFNPLTFQACQDPSASNHLNSNLEEETSEMDNEGGESEMDNEHEVSHPYVGMWVTTDGSVRHELLPNGRYDEARGNRQSAYQGRYTIEGNHIEYVDDTGFTADGDFIDGVLYHAGMVLYLEEQNEGSAE